MRSVMAPTISADAPLMARPMNSVSHGDRPVWSVNQALA